MSENEEYFDDDEYDNNEDDYGEDREDREDRDDSDDEYNTHGKKPSKDEDEEYEEVEEKSEFVNERDAYERSGGKRTLLDFIANIYDISKGDYQRRMIQSTMSDEERFKWNLQPYINSISNKISMSEKDIEKINYLIDTVPNIKFKNGPAFLMAYYVCMNGKISKEHFKIASDISVNTVTPSDIIRYSRLLIPYI